MAGAKTIADRKMRRAKILVHDKGLAVMHMLKSPAKKIGIDAHIPDETQVQM